MGNLIWHDWARFVSITASVYAVWAGYWGIFYRKFFWDFVGGIVRDPGGLQAPASAALFINVIVKIPLIQIFVMLHALFVLALEWPLPLMKNLSIYRSIVVRIVLLVSQASIAILFYQGTNAAMWSLIAALAYTRAQALGEEMEEAKENRGRDGHA